MQEDHQMSSKQDLLVYSRLGKEVLLYSLTNAMRKPEPWWMMEEEKKSFKSLSSVMGTQKFQFLLHPDVVFILPSSSHHTPTIREGKKVVWLLMFFFFSVRWNFTLIPFLHLVCHKMMMLKTHECSSVSRLNRAQAEIQKILCIYLLFAAIQKDLSMSGSLIFLCWCYSIIIPL